MDDNGIFGLELVQEVVLVDLSSVLHNNIRDVLNFFISEPIRNNREVILLEDLRPNSAPLSLFILLHVLFWQISLLLLCLPS